MAKILVADDDRDVRELSIFSLRFAGHDALGASTGEEAISQARLVAPDLIVMDVRMPRMNGFEACRILKADPDTATIPVIFLSAWADEAEVQAGVNAGGVDYLLKPISPDELTTKVNFHLRKAVK